MSNFIAIAVMLAINLVAFMVYYTGDKWIHNRIEIVLHGVSSSIPVSLRQRKLILTNAFVPTVTIAVLMPVTMGFGFVGLARNVSDGFVESFALFCAFFYGFAAVSMPVSGLIWFAYLRSVLRDAEPVRQIEAD